MRKLLATMAILATATVAHAGEFKDIQKQTVNGFEIECKTRSINDIKTCHIARLTMGGITIHQNVYREGDYYVAFIGHDFPGSSGAYRADDAITMRFGKGTSLEHLDYFKNKQTLRVEYSHWPKGKQYAEYSIAGLGEAIEVLDTMTKGYK